MITKKIKTTGGDLKITIPSEISELTIGMLIDLTPEPGDMLSPLQQLSVLSGIQKEYSPGQPDAICLEDVERIDDLSVFDDTLQAIAYQIKSFVIEQELPEAILIPVPQPSVKRWFGIERVHAGKMVKVISNLGIEPAGAYMEAKELIKSEYEEWDRIKKWHGDHIEFSPSIHSLCKLLALYFYCPATGEKFNTIKANEFQSAIRQLQITKALPIARYFFLKYPNLSKPKVAPLAASLKGMKLQQG